MGDVEKPHGPGQHSGKEATQEPSVIVFVLHFFNDVNVKTSSCYIFSFILRTHLRSPDLNSSFLKKTSAAPHGSIKK